MTEPDPMVRSAIPKVVGILLVIFGAFAFFWTLFALMNSSMADVTRRFMMFRKLQIGSSSIELVIAGLQFISGIKAIGYKYNAPKYTAMYAIGNIATTVIWVGIIFLYFKPKLASYGINADVAIGFSTIFGALISMGWSMTALVLMTRPSARNSCTNF